ncbi:MAG: hypothetical protein AB7P20_08800 [Rhizobiaceae bacterium]
MADFVAVLKKTLDGLGDPSPEVRQRVYERARSTVLAKLEAITPPPPQAVVDRQIKALEDAIASIERDFAPPPAKKADPLDELEDVFASLNGLKDRATIPPPRPVAPASPPRSAPPPEPPAAATAAPRANAQASFTASAESSKARATGADPAQTKDVPTPQASNDDDAFPSVARVNDDTTTDGRRKRGFGTALAALLALAVVAGGAYGVWLNKDDFSRLVGLTPPADAPTAPLQTEPSPPSEDVAAAEPAAAVEQPAPEAAAPGEPAPKLTQRLNEDGSEADAGPATGAPSIGEGTSVAEVTPPAAAPAPAEPAPAESAAPTPPPEPATPTETPPNSPAATEAPAATPPAEPATPSDTTAETPPPAEPAAPPATTPPAETATAPPAEGLAVGQKAIFYEEKTTGAQGSMESGTTVWSVVQESPGGGRPPEPAIRAETTIPGKDVQLRLTIRRNADTTLPASHIVEMIFLTPDGFEGGGVDNVLRMAMKSSEQDAGSPLVGIPAKIADGFFLIALNDNKAEIDANMNLLLRQSWIDIPMVYKSGRRALITMEKGIPGEKVFDDTLKSWGVATSG